MSKFHYIKSRDIKIESIYFIITLNQEQFGRNIKYQQKQRISLSQYIYGSNMRLLNSQRERNLKNINNNIRNYDKNYFQNKQVIKTKYKASNIIRIKSLIPQNTVQSKKNELCVDCKKIKKKNQVQISEKKSTINLKSTRIPSTNIKKLTIIFHLYMRDIDRIMIPIQIKYFFTKLNYEYYSEELNFW